MLQANSNEDPRTEQHVRELIATGESNTLEFKASLRWDRRQEQVNKKLERVVVKTVAGFLNAKGGTLLIGVDDSGAVVGLAADYGTLTKQDRDGFELHLRNILVRDLGEATSASLLNVDFHKLDGQDICQVKVEPSGQPIYVEHQKAETFYLRVGNMTRELPVKEAVMYVGQHWGPQGVVSRSLAKAMEDTVTNTERGQRQERLKNAIEHLGNESDSVRLGAAYEFFRLAKDTDDLRQTVLDILCAHIRGTTRTVGYQQEHASEPSEEVQSLLTLLFVSEDHVFKGLRANLEESFLNGARLPGVRLAQASLREVQLRNANLWGAELQGADMESACLQDATMFGAQLQGAVLTSANLQGAKLRDAGLQGGHLMHAQLQNAHLVEAKLQGADIRNAGLHGADLSGAKLQGARMNFAKLQGASLAGASFHGVDSKSAADPREPVTQIRNRTGRESDLSTVAFSGGVTKTDVQALTTDMSDGWADQLRAQLEEHVGKPRSRKPPNGVITGAYSATEAENWIAEYEQAVAASRERECDRGGR